MFFFSWRLIYFIRQSQRWQDPIWVFSAKRPTPAERKWRRVVFFNPISHYLDRQRSKKAWRKQDWWTEEGKRRRLRENIFISIFIDLNALQQRWAAFKDAFGEYKDWFQTQTWLGDFYERRQEFIKPLFLNLAVLFAIPVISLWIWPPILRWWHGYYSLKWVGVALKQWFWLSVKVGFSFVYVWWEVLAVFVFPFSLFLLYLFLYSLACKFLVWWYCRVKHYNSTFERGVLLSQPALNWKYVQGVRGKAGAHSLGIRPVHKLYWRVSGLLVSRYAKVLDRFVDQQFPYGRQDNELHLPYLGVKGAGWVKFESPLRSAGFYSSFFPLSLMYRYWRLRRWRDVSMPLKWIRWWGRGRFRLSLLRPITDFKYKVFFSRRGFRALDRRYDRYISLYGNEPEVLKFKRHCHHMELAEHLVLSYIAVLVGTEDPLSKPIIPFVGRPYPWWIYRNQFLGFLYQRGRFMEDIPLYKDNRTLYGRTYQLFRFTAKAYARVKRKGPWYGYFRVYGKARKYIQAFMQAYGRNNSFYRFSHGKFSRSIFFNYNRRRGLLGNARLYSLNWPVFFRIFTRLRMRAHYFAFRAWTRLRRKSFKNGLMWFRLIYVFGAVYFFLAGFPQVAAVWLLAFLI